MSFLFYLKHYFYVNCFVFRHKTAGNNGFAIHPYCPMAPWTIFRIVLQTWSIIKICLCSFDIWIRFFCWTTPSTFGLWQVKTGIFKVFLIRVRLPITTHQSIHLPVSRPVLATFPSLYPSLMQPVWCFWINKVSKLCISTPYNKIAKSGLFAPCSNNAHPCPSPSHFILSFELRVL